MKKGAILLSLPLCLSAGIASASILPELADCSWVAALSGGPIWSSNGETQTFYLTPTIEKTYVAAKKTKTLATGELFLGLQKPLPYQLQGQFGLAFAATTNARLNGIIWDDTEPQFDNHSYQYSVNARRIAVKGKLLADRNYFLTPWISGSVGVGLNRSHGYTNTPLIPEALVNPNFSNHTKSSFSYSLGIGLQKNLNEHWQVGAGYEFVNWGKSELGRAYDQTLNTGLSQNHFYTNGLMFNVTYIA
ncbi:outer membrane protein [Legionella dresdenensis]|uniref:Outer membrane protein n=1 Tax=Legionella dresdenensis TaxID=450200 RepID=A0ABV8CH17_9GAMM